MSHPKHARTHRQIEWFVERLVCRGARALPLEQPCRWMQGVRFEKGVTDVQLADMMDIKATIIEAMQSLFTERQGAHFICEFFCKTNFLCRFEKPHLPAKKRETCRSLAKRGCLGAKHEHWEHVSRALAKIDGIFYERIFRKYDIAELRPAKMRKNELGWMEVVR